MLGAHFRPLGAREPSRSGISRRVFLGAGVATPVAMAIAVQAQAAAPANSDDLRFVEDAEGVSVINPADAVWRLHRIAFGPSTVFALRTLQDGREKGYEIEISGVRFDICRE